MKTIGILGGMSPESTVAYYRLITRTYMERFGDHGYPPVVIYSVSFQPYIDWPAAGAWDQVAAGLGEAAQRLESAGADFVVIATNTMHRVIDEVRAQVSLPVLSILDVVADAIEARRLARVGLLGTRFTMEQRFYHEALGRRGIGVITPPEEDRALVNHVIYNELVGGTIRAESRDAVTRVIARLAAQGAEGVILGCTELPLLVNEALAGMPVLDTTRLHALAALEHALA